MKTRAARYLSVIIAIVLAAALVFPAYADSSISSKEPIHQMEIPAESNSGVRSEAEIESLLTVYREVFPEEYIYLTEYLENGINLSEYPKKTFEETRTKNEIDYSLIVYSNRQIFIVIAYEAENDNRQFESPRATDPVARQKTVVVGDLNYYNTFVVNYMVDYYGYDFITGVSTTGGAGWIPSWVESDYYETASRGAYYIFRNSYCANPTINVLYNLGVSVGNNKCVGYCDLADDWTAYFMMLVYTLLYNSPY